MPNPILFLENHNQSGTRRFIADNIPALKKLGYTKFLLEMNREISPAELKQQCNDLLSSLIVPKSSSTYLAIKALTDLLIVLEEQGISYDFIDPETQAEALAIAQAFSAAKVDSERKRLEAVRKKATLRRDKEMAQIIKREAEVYEGGIFFLGGFEHTTLVQELKQIDPNRQYSPVVCINRDESTPTISPGGIDMSFDCWMNLQNEAYREEFYGSKVHLINMAEKPSLEACSRIYEFIEYRHVGKCH